MVAGRQATEAPSAAAVVRVPFGVCVEAKPVAGCVIASTRVASGWTVGADDCREVLQVKGSRCRFALKFSRDVVPALRAARGAIAFSNVGKVIGRDDELRVDSSGKEGASPGGGSGDMEDEEEGGEHVNVKCR